MTIATGIKAQNLREFREGLARVPESCLRHHFWGRLLSPRFDEPEYSNDFASWAFHALHEKALAERLSAVDPTAHDGVESLRQDLIEVVELTLDTREVVPWAAHMTTTSIYYHFIDARHRTPTHCDDFCAWLDPWGPAYADLKTRLHDIDPFFSSLKEIRRMILEVCTRWEASRDDV